MTGRDAKEMVVGVPGVWCFELSVLRPLSELSKGIMVWCLSGFDILVDSSFDVFAAVCPCLFFTGSPLKCGSDRWTCGGVFLVL